MHSLLAGWRLSLRRTRADWPIVAAAWLITLLATVLFAAGPIYSSAAAIAGLRRTLDDAAVVTTAVQISTYGTPKQVAGVDGEVQADLLAALSPLAAPIFRDGRAAASFALPATSGETKDRAILGFLDGLPEHAHLIGGAWPSSGSQSDALQVVVVDAVASALQLSVGDELELAAPNVSGASSVPVSIVGIFSVDDAADPYWYGDTQLSSGITKSGSDRVLGPFLTAPEGILQNAALTSVHLQWRAIPDFGGLTVDNVGAIRGGLEALPNRLRDTSADIPSVATGLPAILEAAERSLLVSRTELLLVMAQLAILAAYAIVLTASLLVDHRRVETALLRSRGAGAGRIAWLAFTEALLLVVPAVLIAPWLAVGETAVLNFAGPLAEIGLAIQPAVTRDSYLLAAAAGAGCLALLVLPAFLGARNFASAERELSRQETRTFGQRLGLDIALLAVSAIALWQLQLYGAPLTRTVQGSLGFDPLLVAAPAVGLLAGGVLALRILPLLAAALEGWVSRGREVVASLGSRQLARRPLRYTRTGLLLILALSLGVFALAYADTWSGSQNDQATYQVGADVRAGVASGAGASGVLPAADYAAIDGVEAAMPVERLKSGVWLGNGPIDGVLALNADTASSIVRFRGDESAQTLDELMRALRDGRPAPGIVTLPDDAEYLRIVPELKVYKIAKRPRGQDAVNGVEPEPIDPATLTDLRMSATAVVRDAEGLLYRLPSQSVAVDGTDTPILVSLRPMQGALQLAGLEVGLSLPVGTLTTSASAGVSDLSVGASEDGPWQSLALDGWAARMSPDANLSDQRLKSGELAPVAADHVDGMVIDIDGRLNRILSAGPSPERVLFIASAIDALDPPLPVIANPAFLAASGTTPGDTAVVSIDGARRRITVVGVVDAFPTMDPAGPLLVFDQPTLDLLRLQATGEVLGVDEWWLAVTPGTSAQVTSTLRAAPFSSPEVVSSVERTQALSTDPVALAIIGALLLGFVATGVFALVALVVSAAVSARQRRTEFALMRALGLSARQLSGWLWLENGSLVVVSLIAGTGVGVVISWIALPFITVTQQAATPVPSVLVHMPWERILMLDLIVVIALGIAVAVLAAVMRRIGVGSILRLGED